MQPRRKEKYLFELAAVLKENGLPQPNASRFPPLSLVLVLDGSITFRP